MSAVSGLLLSKMTRYSSPPDLWLLPSPPSVPSAEVSSDGKRSESSRVSELEAVEASCVDDADADADADEDEGDEDGGCGLARVKAA